MMLIADTRPSRSGGVTVCRSVVVLMTHRIGPAPSRKKPRPASSGVGTQIVESHQDGAGKPRERPDGDDGAESQPAHDPGASSAPTTMPTPNIPSVTPTPEAERPRL